MTTKLKKPPFEIQPMEIGRKEFPFWSLPWFEWVRDVQFQMNNRPTIADIAEGNLVVVDSDGNLADSGETPTSLVGTDAATTEYVRDYAGERFITENLLDEAGTETGARFGNYKIGLNDEDNYIHFDGDGNVTFGGTTTILGYRATIVSQTTDKTLVLSDMYKVHWFTGVTGGQTRDVYLPSVSSDDIGTWVMIGFRGPGVIKIFPADSDRISNCPADIGWLECSDQTRDDSVICLRLDFETQWVFGKGCFGVWSTKST